MVDAAVETARFDRTLFAALVEARQTRDTGKPALSDPLGTKLSYRKLILGAQVLGAKLEPLAPVGGAVGVMLPNSAGVAVAFFALQAVGRVPAMINFTSGAANIKAACRAAGVSVIVTLARLRRQGAPDARSWPSSRRACASSIWRTCAQTIGIGDKVAGVLAGARQRVAREPDDPAVILFTSGSEGMPKGVVLSHRNILANTAQCLARLAANGEDMVFNVLPVFHSFGLTGGLMMPLLGGVPVYLYPSPLHYRIVPELLYDTGATILFGTDTFLRGYARTAHPYDLRSVRLIVAGAEAVKESTRHTYMERFGVRILEGYGVTETAPVLAMNTPIANKAGTVGRLSPLMRARLEPVAGITEGGRLFVQGPNVMLGYYRAENPGVLEAPADGWHDTGDIVAIDAQGFITIKGRAKRFAKIGGEMVSLAAVEALAAEACPRRGADGRVPARCAQGRASRAVDHRRQRQARRVAAPRQGPRRRRADGARGHRAGRRPAPARHRQARLRRRRGLGQGEGGTPAHRGSERRRRLICSGSYRATDARTVRDGSALIATL